MTLQEFCTHYLEPSQRGMAFALLTEADRSLEEWRDLWARTLQQPAK